MFFFIHLFESLFGVGDTHTPATGQFTIDQFDTRTIVFQLQQQFIGKHLGAETDGAASFGLGDGIFDRVFHQRLQNQAGYQSHFGIIFNLEIQFKFLFKPHLFNPQIQLQGHHLLFQRNFLHRVVVQRIAQKIRQANHHFIGPVITFV